MEDDPLDHSNDFGKPAQATEDAGTCPLCGSPISEQAEGVDPESAAVESLPTEEECWNEFWTRLAHAWRDMPPDLQKQCIAEAALLDPLTRCPSGDRGPDQPLP